MGRSSCSRPVAAKSNLTEPPVEGTIICLPFFPSPQECDTALAEDLIVEYQFGRLVCHAEIYMERQQMLLTGVTVACGRPFLPNGS
jgi:hypothetical protein